MKKCEFYGVITAKEEFLYPDTTCEYLPNDINIVTAKNGVRGVQLLLKTQSEKVEISSNSDSFQAEYFEMIKVPVEYNTGDGEEQGGSMVLQKRPKVKPAYVTRLAPFEVFDCLKPMLSNEVSPIDGLLAVYICFKPTENISIGENVIDLTVKLQEGIYECKVTVQVYPVMIPDESFSVTNWFSLDDICRFHQVEFNSDEYCAMLKQYANAMRRTRQTLFFISIDERCIVSNDSFVFDFEYLKKTISIFFEAGMKKMEVGSLLSRGCLPDGSPDMYTDSFKCAMAPTVPIDSLEGYEITVKYIQQLSKFLTENGWEDKVLFHIHDEPDIHYKGENCIAKRKRDFYLAASILRKYLPHVQVIEAAKTTLFRGGIDILVPDTAGYESRKPEFDKLISLGEEVWNYVCCGPQGHWLNRFLDFAVLKNRILFWGFAKNKLAGFLHWGFNHFPGGMNPFEGTSCPNNTGIGTNFPCGDSFIVYPGEDGPYIGLRLEVQRRGAEDVDLLNMLLIHDVQKFNDIISKVFQNNYTYNEDPQYFEEVYEQLLKELSVFV